MPTSPEHESCGESCGEFCQRHIGPRPADLAAMLRTVRVGSLAELMDETIPAAIRSIRPLALPPALSEHAALGELARLGQLNRRVRAFVGMGYAEAILPSVIARNVLANPGWYTAYTPYQAEISQGRLEALLNFQTMVMDLCGMEVAGASLLDEATAAAEAMHMLASSRQDESARAFFVSELCHPQTIAVVRTRAESLGIAVVVGDHSKLVFDGRVCAALVQYPATDGKIFDYRDFCAQAHAGGARVAVAADLLALALLVPPGELGADVALGSTQRFGLPLGYGGPHAAFLATRKEYTRKMPGRFVGVARDAHGHTALRLALQTREQHIRREKATSNICTAQVLPAVMASMYAVYHGAEGIRAIAARVAGLTASLAQALTEAGLTVLSAPVFDTIRVDGSPAAIAACHARAEAAGICLRRFSPTVLTITLDEATTRADIATIARVMAPALAARELPEVGFALPPALQRGTPFLQHPVFSAYRSETEMLRYLHQLQSKDISLADSMIALGSCTMKLNAATEMLPLGWPEWNNVHPFVPREYAQGYAAIIADLETMLAEITGFAAVSLQPNAGSQGEYAGLLVVRKYHLTRGDHQRDVCLIPSSAHGTNPASAVMAGYRVVVVACDAGGNVDAQDLTAKAQANADRLAAMMLTYPSTHGVFEEGVQRLCQIVHEHGGLVYMDGANMNGQVGLCRPAELGADVCHINLHKTFASPHGGGGPGAGPIAVAAHLAPFLPSHPVVPTGGEQAIGAVSAAPWAAPTFCSSLGPTCA